MVRSRATPAPVAKAVALAPVALAVCQISSPAGELNNFVQARFGGQTAQNLMGSGLGFLPFSGLTWLVHF